MSQDRYRKVPSVRLSRLASFGQLAGGIAGGMMAEGVRRLARGERPQMSDLLLTPGNAMRLTDQLSRLRGAAMKLGQMISLDAGDLLPAELTAILARLRDAAHFMPPAQLNQVLQTEWGKDWRRRFARFEATPVAAASIGQVHRATLPDGRVLAIKVQYPGVAASIDADVDNVATLLRLSGLLPETLDVAPLLAEAKRQLREEADYLREADQMRRYGALLADHPAFVLPAPVAELSGERVLAMDFLPGQPIETLLQASQEVRDQAMAALLELVLRELFEFGYMQTDPNFANFRWQADTGRIVLLDFGAARAVPDATVAAYRRLMHAGLAEDRAALRDALLAIGFVSPVTLERHSGSLDAMIDVLIGHLGRPGLFDFADRSFVAEVRRHAETIAADRAAWHIPPADTLFVQRKVSGTALLAVRMEARLPLRDMVAAKLA
ncbi:AarF/ABC1/UbiB kinase family protein [Novosphingobium sp.]|uniref:ABC1 kinase family protein n=1 Tax=Novosphingobium sp. TaxID=1874826 RepID=UPI0022CC47E2|nr:AarF/ABC1/UbiB kinase family protein [Novosphingobium sp.]MCZ8019050.1 AarF/ABC1/UbiB kinase family protein [Novosphingobium sp.]MCZ8034858.1 AarF/ABC1/UbiB kinase family protein [Novosphingobium sp.]MCZ8052426.1 AarF/ABC1/UbiB kinase family protein [Novosphingobium sp.]MCZ8058525.1 AarF/ABC1/UbiB kinase family protein [Novosphingobium sp.]MCZ8232922.1 AarF/ABC1/UbiB kinase family protein [Novosphingobium sp.]